MDEKYIADKINKILMSHPVVEEAYTTINRHFDSKYFISHITYDGSFMDTDHSEDSEEQLSIWEDIFDDAYMKYDKEGEQQLNTSSWYSSYTKQKISLFEMNEWLEDTIRIIKSFKPKKVLEIGCGTGMILFKIAQICKEYVGIDLSKVGLNHIRNHLNDDMNVRLYQGAADDLQILGNEKFDVIIVNSVIQYFPSGDYLDNIIKCLIERLEKGGFLFIGDVRSRVLFEHFHTSVRLFQADDNLTLNELTKQVYKSKFSENELLVNPLYFTGLSKTNAKVKQVNIMPRVSNYLNEMSKYRYQVIISTEETPYLPDVSYVEWGSIGSEERFISLLNERSDNVILINNVPFNKLSEENCAVNILKHHYSSIELVKDLKEKASTQKSFSPDLYQLITDRTNPNYHMFALWENHNDSGDYQLLLINKKLYPLRPNIHDFRIASLREESYEAKNYFISPLKMKEKRELSQLLRKHLRNYLPAELVPEFLILNRNEKK